MTHYERTVILKPAIKILLEEYGWSKQRLIRELALDDRVLSPLIEEWGFERGEDYRWTVCKPALEYLRSNEGKSANELEKYFPFSTSAINRHFRQWGTPEFEKKDPLSPSARKFLNANRQLIKSRLDNDIQIGDICEELGVNRAFLSQTIIPNDEILKQANAEYLERLHKRAKYRKDEKMERSSHDYLLASDFPEDENWKTILGYSSYEVSDKGRIRRYKELYDAYLMLKISVNPRDERNQITLTNDFGKKHTLKLARIVAHAFCPKENEEQNTVNHKDGNTLNDNAENLEWTTQQENNQHMYTELKYTHKGQKPRWPGCKFIYKDEYEFKTINALAKFLGKSRTQTTRYLEEPHLHDLKIVKKNCND